MPFRCVAACDKCALLSREDNLTKLQERAWDETLHAGESNVGYLTPSQMRARSAMHKKEAKTSRRVLLGRESTLAKLTRVLEKHKQIMVYMAEHNIARVHAVLAHAANSGRGVDGTLALLKKAQAGLYHAKGYSEEELDEGILNLRLGGRKLIYALNHGTAGAASARTVRAFAKLPPYLTCAIEINVKIIRANFERHLFSRPVRDERVLHHLMMDDVKGSSRLRISHVDGCIRGICYHGLGVVDPKLTSYEQAELIASKISSGEIHHGTEITNVAIAANAEKGYKPIVVATSAGCTTGDPVERTKLLLHYVLQIWKTDPRGCKARGPISTLQPDGASVFVKAAQGMFFVKKMDEGHPLHCELAGLKLFNLHVAIDANYVNSTAGCEQKHTGKRARERAKSEVGMRVGEQNGPKLTGSFWRKLMSAARGALGITETDIHKMFATGFADAQRVAPMIMFFRTVAKMGEMSPDDFGEMSVAFSNTHRDIRLYSRFSHLLCTLLADKRHSLAEQLANVSELSHIVLTIYSRHRTTFIPAQNYRNQQSMYRSIFWSVATAKVEHIAEYFIYQDSGDALENVYNICRSFFPGEAMDLLQVRHSTPPPVVCPSPGCPHPYQPSQSPLHLSHSSRRGSVPRCSATLSSSDGPS